MLQSQEDLKLIFQFVAQEFSRWVQRHIPCVEQVRRGGKGGQEQISLDLDYSQALRHELVLLTPDLCGCATTTW